MRLIGGEVNLSIAFFVFCRKINLFIFKQSHNKSTKNSHNFPPSPSN